jgi:hypothetical protein
VCFATSALCAVRPLARRNEKFLARVSLLAGIAIFLGFFGGILIPGLSSPTEASGFQW